MKLTLKKSIDDEPAGTQEQSEEKDPVVEGAFTKSPSTQFHR